MKDGLLCLWAEVDTEAETEDVELLVRGTGHPVPDDAEFLGTAMDSPFVWHLFSERRGGKT
jgi:hypothetical protein